MIDLELFGGFDFTQTDEQTDERTLVVVESLSRLKLPKNGSLDVQICAADQKVVSLVQI